MLSDEQFIRYQRQVSLVEFGENGQEKLLKSHALVIGCGGLGNAAALYLAASGVGKLVLIDDDIIESSNLQRQVAFQYSDIGQTKTQALANRIQKLNSDCDVRILTKKADYQQLVLEVMLADIVLDCTDNFPSRQQINRACFRNKTPLISASAIGWNGQFVVFDFERSTDSGCYRCLFPFEDNIKGQRCSDSGVIGPVVGTMGNLQALAAIQKLATGNFMVPSHELKLFDGKTMNWQNLSMQQDISCPVCNEKESLFEQECEVIE